MDSTVNNHQDSNSTREQSSTPLASVNAIQQAKKMPMQPTPLEYSCWSTYSIGITQGFIVLFMVISAAIGVLIVYFTASKVTTHHCQLNFKKTGHNPLDYNYNPRSVAIGDLNNDTYLDFVVTNRGVNDISVFLGSPNNTFRQSTTYSTGSHSLADKVLIADLNNDRHLDIIVAYFGTNSIGIFLGLGDGVFVDHTTISTNSSRPIWMHIAHLDNDIFFDLVTADHGTDSITVFSGDGTGNFSYRMRYSTGYDSLPVSVISADLNNDHRLDLAVVNSGTNNIGIFLGKGNGEFSDQKLFSTGINSHPNSIGVGHFNSDKLLDIVVASYGTNTVGVFWNTGKGTFVEQRIYILENASPYFIDVGDMNKDQRSDIVIISRDTNKICILLGYANGNFSRPIMFTTGSSSSISAAIDDLNRDDLPDIIVINNDTNSITIFFSKQATFQSEIKYSNIIKSSFTQLDTTNNNVQLDMIDGGSHKGKVRVRRQHDSETCSSLPWAELPSGTFSLPTGDFNNDGHLDMIITNIRWKELVMFLGYGNGSFTYKTVYRMNNSWWRLEAADLDGNTHMDLVLAYTDEKDVNVHINVLLGYGNGSFTKHATYRTGCMYDGLIVIKDFNKDNQLDVLIGDLNGIISILLGIGDGNFANPMIHSVDDFLNSIAVGDFNNDTILDIVFTNTVQDRIGVLFGYGNGSFVKQPIRSTLSSPKSIAVSDLNNDTVLDVVIRRGVYEDYDDHVSVLIGFGNGSFQDPLNIFAGDGVIDATLGDFNNDNRMDIAVVNYKESNMHILLGYGNGSFANYSTCLTGQGPNLAVVADFNNDGQSDIVVANSDVYGISVFIFSLIDFRSESISSGSSNGSRLQCIGADDFNNDNILDIVVVNYGTKNIALLLGHGDGSFEKQTVVQLDWNSNPRSITIGDFNRDNQLDIAVANAGTYNIDTLLGDGKGALIRQNNDGYSLNRPPSTIVADDFNHDGLSEVILVYDNSDDIDILIVYDPGNFTDQIVYSTDFRPGNVLMGDFNEDKILDIVITFSDDNKIGILFGHGDGSFTNHMTYSTGSSMGPIALGYFNNDSHLDIVFANNDNTNIRILFGYGNGSFTKRKTYSIGFVPFALAVSDLNNDSFSDIVMLVLNSKSVQILFSYGNGSFVRLKSLQTHSWTTDLAIGDVNNDRFMDIIVSNSDGEISVFFGYGNGSFRVPIINLYKVQSSFLTIGDFNNDARLDIVLVSSYEEIEIFLGYGNGSFTKHTTYSVGCSPRYVTVADLNNDTQLDIVTVNSEGDNITVLLGNGNGSFRKLPKYRTGSAPNCAVIGDFNNDSQMDIVVTNGDFTISILLGNFNQVFKRQITLINGNGSFPPSIATGDFNNDTHSDIVVISSTTKGLGVFLGHGNGSFSTPILSPTVSSASLIAVGHLNNDTYLDVVLVHINESTIVIHLGNGNGSFSNHSTLITGDYTQPKSVSVADFNNDAVLDIIIVNSNSSNVIVFIGYGNGSYTLATEIRIGYGAHPFSVAVGDYNNDKKLDFAVANYESDNLEIYLQSC